MENLFEVKNLQFSFRTYGGVVKADETESGTAWIL